MSLFTCSKVESVSVALFELATVIQLSINCPVVVLLQCVLTFPVGFTHILTLQPVWTDTIRDMSDCSTARWSRHDLGQMKWMLMLKWDVAGRVECVLWLLVWLVGWLTGCLLDWIIESFVQALPHCSFIQLIQVIYDLYAKFNSAGLKCVTVVQTMC